MGVSRDRVVRMRAIGQHLAESSYDIVCLQEVWCPEDYITICGLTRDVLPYNHFFDHGIIGSGTCVLSKAQILDSAFHEFSQNGYPHKILHGDWFAGKGIGICNIDYKGLNINVFVSHFHAEYDRTKDIYVGHRVMQALEAAQWIKLTSSGADLTIYAGDFNTEPTDVPYWLLRTVAQLQDCWSECHQDDAHGLTCDASFNTYSGSNSVGKRIDYIMYRPGTSLINTRVSCQSCHLPLNRRIPESLAARIGREVSYSDHEAVTSVIRVEKNAGAGDFSWSHMCRTLVTKRDETVTVAMDLINNAIVGTSRDQKLYSLLLVVALLLFMCTFTQLLYSGILLECAMFLVRLVLSLTAVYALCMATIFNRRERNALSATKSTLQLLKSQQCKYGSM